jgi:hypothetical protein
MENRELEEKMANLYLDGPHALGDGADGAATGVAGAVG